MPEPSVAGNCRRSRTKRRSFEPPREFRWRRSNPGRGKPSSKQLTIKRATDLISTGQAVNMQKETHPVRGGPALEVTRGRDVTRIAGLLRQPGGSTSR